MLASLFTGLRAVAWLKRSALAQERIAAALEDHLARQAGGGAGLRTFYQDRSEGEGALFTQTDEDMARLEELEKRRERGQGAVGLDDDLEET